MVYGDLVYGGACVYGGDVPCTPPPAPEFDHCQTCSEGWRFEATDLNTGIVKAVLHPITSEWSEQYSRPGVGSLMLATKDPSADDVWPHTTGLYISRVARDGTRTCHFGGFVEAVDANGGGASNLGLQSIDEYLFHRLLANADEGIAYSTPGYVSPEEPGDGLEQTMIAAELVGLATAGEGAIPLIPIAEPSSQIRVRSWAAHEFKNIGEAIEELVNAADGVQYRLEHRFFENPARWTTYIRFFDELSVNRGVELRPDHGAWNCMLTLDGTAQASRMFGVGVGEGATQMFSVAVDEDASLPEFQATVAWKDIKVPESLDEQTRGELTLRRDPVAIPEATLLGLTEVPPETVVTGDILAAEIGHGVYTFKGEMAQVDSQGWRLEEGSPVSRVVGLQPIIRPSLSIKTQTPAVAPPEETLTPEQAANPPAQTPISPPVSAAGLVTVVQVGSLTEISGMQYMGDGNVWVHNDENNNPQVIAVSLTTGREAGNVNVGAPARKDPEAIRKHPDGRVLLGDIGDNDNNRSSVRLYVVGGSDSYQLSYPFGPSNAEALLIHPTSGEIFIADKSGRVVSFGSGPSSSGTQVASGLPGNISDGTFTNDGKFVLFTVAGASVVYVHAYPGFGAVGTIPIPGLPKCEAITVDSDCSFLVTTEGASPPIYRVLIPKAYGGCA